MRLQVNGLENPKPPLYCLIKGTASVWITVWEQVLQTKPRGAQKQSVRKHISQASVLAYVLPDKPYVFKLNWASTLKGQTWDHIGHQETDGQNTLLS